MIRKYLRIPVLLCAIPIATAANAQMTVEEMELIDEGFKVFTEETFDGNGRTCATCHLPKEAYNIFPASIEELSADQKDLVLATNVPGLENPDLVKSHALFNISGGADVCPADSPSCFGTPGEEHSGPIFRSTMGPFAQDITSINTRPLFPGSPLLPANCSAGGLAQQQEQFGWAGDGAPGSMDTLDPTCKTHHGHFDPDADGTLRGFANGAIAQHSTKSLERNLGTDFRFATADELDAMDAFQRWLGRRPLTGDENAIQGTITATEFDINLLDFSDARVALGRDHFFGGPEILNAPPPAPPGTVIIDPDAGAGCDACHGNAGSNGTIGPPGFPANINVNTEVELGSDDIGLAVVGIALPHDEGGADSFPPPGPPSFDEAFNIQSVIEAPQKKAWFHNHRVLDDFEDAIAFYISDDFVLNAVAVTSPNVMRNGNANGSISFPNGDGIEHLGAFLRTLNAFYNLRNCERLLDEAIDRVNAYVDERIAIKHCGFDLKNAHRVLQESKLPDLYPDVVYGAKYAYGELKDAYGNTHKLAGIRDYIRGLRDSMATQISPEI